MIIDRQQQRAWDKIINRLSTVASNEPSPPSSGNAQQVPGSPRSHTTEISLNSIPPTYQESQQQLEQGRQSDASPRIIGVGRYRVDVREQERTIEPAVDAALMEPNTNSAGAPIQGNTVSDPGALQASSIPAFLPSQPPIAHLRLIHSASSISGSYILDPSIPSPLAPSPPSDGPLSSLDPPIAFPPPTACTSAYLFTRQGEVKSKLLVRGGEQAGRSAIETHVEEGNVVTEVRDDDFVEGGESVRRVGGRRDVRVGTKKGNITLILPPSFHGPLLYRLSPTSTLLPSPLMSARLRTFSYESNLGRGEILPSPSYVAIPRGDLKEEEEDEDTLEIFCDDGLVRVAEVGEFRDMELEEAEKEKKKEKKKKVREGCMVCCVM